MKEKKDIDDTYLYRQSNDRQPIPGEAITEVTPDGSVAIEPGGDTKIHTDGKKAQRLRMKLKRLPILLSGIWREYRRDARLHIKESAAGFALGCCAYLLGSCRLMFGTSPLGLALLCAAPKRILWIFLGACISALSLPEFSYIYIFAYVTAVAVRILARLLVDTPMESEGELASPDVKETVREAKIRIKSAFTESIYLRMATGAASAFMISLYILISRSFEYYDLFAAIFAIVCTPAAIFVCAGCFEENGCPPAFRELSVGALLVSLTFSMRHMYLIGVSAGAFFAYFVTLYVCRQSGLWKGTLLGLICGLAYAPEYAPMFALSGLTAGALWNISAFGALVAGGTASMLWGFYIEGVSAMSRLLPAVMLSSVCYMGAQRMALFPAAKDLLFSGKYCTDMNDAYIDRESRDSAYKTLCDLSDTFESLSEIFYNLSDRLSRPEIPELRRMCDKVYDRYCPICPGRDLCWDMEYNASKDMLTSISEKLSAAGVTEFSDFPEYMKSRCVALPGIIGEINQGCAELCRRARLEDKTSVFAMDYGSVSALLSDVGAANRKDYLPDKELSKKLTEVLSEYGFGNGGVSVYGTRRKQIVARGFDISGTGIGVSDLKKRVTRACGFPIGDPVIEMKENMMTMRITSARRFKAKSTVLTGGATDDECGDTVASFENCDDKYFALISDGMGSGKEAAFTSSVCSLFLRKMLGVGNKGQTVIKMLNSFIRSKPGECSSTVDLMELDLLTGRVEFLKCGAAATFVRRENNLFKLAASTLPLGILDSTDAGKLSFDAMDGDVVIMLSDGVAMGNDDCMWLLDLLSSGWTDDLPAMCRKLLAEARAKGSRDDVSVVLTKIDEV